MLSRQCITKLHILPLGGCSKLLYRCHYNWVLGKIFKDDTFLQRCKNAGLTKPMIDSTLKDFRKDLVLHESGTKLDALKVQYVLGSISRSEAVYSSIFPLFLKYAKSKFPVLHNQSELREIYDLTNPAQWYPEARSMERSIVFHAGPTNSGKTHAALERFLSAKSGIYCCPLRLLAREISQRSKAKNVPCNLITGEERAFSRGSKHIACTVEMTNLRQTFDLAVIDEIQIIAHKERGWAWTQALLGLKAKEIHVCGEPRAISIVQQLCADCNDNFEIREYERLTKLRVKKYAVGSIEKLKAGDCIVCFKRRDIFSMVSQLKENGKETSMIYGKLPPYTKRMEARKFNDPSNACNILVATDAIGMGLNLNIKRIVFKSLEKGVKDLKGEVVSTQLTTPEVLQIAGRAGRYGLQESGEVTTLYEEDIHLLHELLLNPKEEIKKARILPTMQRYVKFSEKSFDSNIFKILTDFRKFCRINKSMFQLCSQRDCLHVAESIQKFNLALKDAYIFSLCPINTDSEISTVLFLFFVKYYSKARPVTFNSIVTILRGFSVKIPLLPEIWPDRIAILEDVHNVLGAYLWLSQKFPVHFPDYKEIYDLHQSAGNAVTSSIHNLRNQPSFRKKKFMKNKSDKKGPK